MLDSSLLSNFKSVVSFHFNAADGGYLTLKYMIVFCATCVEIAVCFLLIVLVVVAER